MSSPDGYPGTRGATDAAGEYNALTYIIRELLSTRCHVALVKVIAVDEAGTVDVQPMVNQMDVDGSPIPHGVINGVPWFTLQAGLNAVVLTPEVDDIGLCLFADRDISSVVANRDVSNPGSLRQSDMADGLYLGGYLNAEPTQFVKMSPAGIEITSPNEVALTAPVVTIDAPTSVTVTTGLFRVVGPAEFSGTIQAGGNVTAPDVIFNSISAKTHKHGGKPPTAPGETTLGPQ